MQGRTNSSQIPIPVDCLPPAEVSSYQANTTNITQTNPMYDSNNRGLILLLKLLLALSVSLSRITIRPCNRFDFQMPQLPLRHSSTSSDTAVGHTISNLLTLIRSRQNLTSVMQTFITYLITIRMKNSSNKKTRRLPFFVCM